MARARNIKPSFFQNEDLAELTPITRLAFIGMWTIADFKGCIEFRPKRLKVQLMPYDDCDFEVIANDLDKSGLIAIYSVGGQRYIKITNFEKHQNPHKNERESGSDIPDFTPQSSIHAGSQAIQINPDLNGTAPADSLFPLPDSGLPISAEPQSVSTQAFMMPLIGDKMFPIPEAQIVQWAIAYPAVDVSRQLYAMRQWCVANPTQKKTERGILRFCNSWLMKEQDKPRATARGSPNGYESMKDRERRETIEGLTGGRNERSEATIIDIN